MGNKTKKSTKLTKKAYGPNAKHMNEVLRKRKIENIEGESDHKAKRARLVGYEENNNHTVSSSENYDITFQSAATVRDSDESAVHEIQIENVETIASVDREETNQNGTSLNEDVQCSKSDELLDSATEEDDLQGSDLVTGPSTENDGLKYKEIPIEGRRIVDLQSLINQLFEVSRHSLKFGCALNFLKIYKEVHHGLCSILFMHCSMCGSKFRINTCDSGNNMIDVNHAAVAGIIMIGCGLSNFNELAATLNMPTLNGPQYKKVHEDLHDWWKDAAETTMKEAAEEEAKMATEKSNSGKPMIPVTADACWSKRSYRTNYSSLSGVGSIVGVNTGKVLHIGVKNKYCVVCARAKTKEQDPPDHECNVNHKGSSTSMEQASIVEGFKNSEKVHGLIYSKLIADGDASTYKNILEARPYTSVTVQKIECSNHLLRNYNGKNMNLSKDTGIPIDQRRLLTTERLNRLRTAVKAAVRFRNAQNSTLPEKIQDLQKDITNSPLHILGDHTNCENYYCSNNKKNEPNYVPHATVLIAKLSANASALAYHAKSLLHNLNNNRAEQFNSMVSKYVGGKRINYALKKSYALRCYAAVVAFNTGKPITALYKKVTGASPSIAVKKFESMKRKTNSSKKKWKPKRRIEFTNQCADYGELCQKPDMTPEEYETAKTEYIESLKTELADREAVERNTVHQSESALWLELRRCLVTASNFGKICKRQNISSAPLVKSLLYSYRLDHVPAISHGKTNESTALAQLADQEKINIRKCGLYVDKDLFFVGASPDAVFDDGIVEIKCPKSGFGMSVDDAIRAKKVNFWKIVKGKIVLNTSHNWYYQVQGQLHVTRQDVCLFGVWNGPDFPIKTEVIRRDDEFWETKMEDRLKKFYYTCLLPEIIDPRKCRSMELRTCSY